MTVFRSATGWRATYCRFRRGRKTFSCREIISPACEVFSHGIPSFASPRHWHYARPGCDRPATESIESADPIGSSLARPNRGRCLRPSITERLRLPRAIVVFTRIPQCNPSLNSTTSKIIAGRSAASSIFKQRRSADLDCRCSGRWDTTLRFAQDSWVGKWSHFDICP